MGCAATSGPRTSAFDGLALGDASGEPLRLEGEAITLEWDDQEMTGSVGDRAALMTWMRVNTQATPVAPAMSLKPRGGMERQNKFSDCRSARFRGPGGGEICGARTHVLQGEWLFPGREEARGPLPWMPGSPRRHSREVACSVSSGEETERTIFFAKVRRPLRCPWRR